MDMDRIAFIGGGNMARSLIGGIRRHGSYSGAIAVSDPHPQRRDALAREFGITAFEDNHDAVAGAQMVVLAVKPQTLPSVCRDLAHTLQRTRPLLLSIAAGIRIEQIQCWLGGGAAIVRCMPNTPSLIGAGAFGLVANEHVSRQQRAAAKRLLAASGLVEWIEREALLDVVTAISGSAPAYFFLMVEALEEAAAAQGLQRESARRLAAQTCLGAGRMLMEGDETPAVLRRRVTSPHGTTQAALDSFADDHFQHIVARAATAAAKRSAELADEND